MVQFSFRWYGDDDPVTLERIGQIPVVKGIVGALFDIPPGRVWPLDRLQALRKTVEDKGFALTAIESIPVHEDIKLGLKTRDAYIDAYCESIRNMGEAGIPVLCYNFMPLFDWVRTDLAMKLPDGSTCLSYDDAAIAGLNLFSWGKSLPAWIFSYGEEEMPRLVDAYRDMGEEGVWDNLRYFLERVVPVAEEADVRMGIHPDDPPWSVFGVPRIITDENALARMLALADSPNNGLSLCSGSFGVSRENDIPRIVRRFGKRIHFAHVRNVKILGGRSFHESAHPSACGSLDIYEILKAYHDVGFSGPMRPDHGRMIWGETGKPGYGLYDRALAVMYLAGLWEAIEKESRA